MCVCVCVTPQYYELQVNRSVRSLHTPGKSQINFVIRIKTIIDGKFAFPGIGTHFMLIEKQETNFIKKITYFCQIYAFSISPANEYSSQVIGNLRVVLWLNMNDICDFKSHIKCKTAF